MLCSEELSPIVELVCWSPEPDIYEVRALDGAVRFRRSLTNGRPSFVTEDHAGRNPVGDQDPTRFSPSSDELANLSPDRTRNSYPHAYEHISQVFDHPCAPDLCVLHTASHHTEDHRGEHGSLGVVQARAPFVASGAGVTRDGITDGNCRLVDFAPTALQLLGITPRCGLGASGTDRDDAYLSRQDGDPVTRILDPSRGRTETVIAFLLDGTNPNMLYEMASSGDAPTFAGLIENGTALRHGAFASLPTVTLPNHTTLLTGCHPGHHGVLHNAWYDRQLGRQVVTESPTTWQEAMRWLRPGIQTIHDVVRSQVPGSCTVSVNEPSDRGASYSTFELFRTDRTRELSGLVGKPPEHTTAEFAGSSDAYKWGSTIDASAVAQATALLRGGFAGTDCTEPAFVWVNTSLTDAASHEAGPHSDMARAAIRDTDARVAEILSVARETLDFSKTTVFVLADHGMELNDPAVTGDWGDALRAAGIDFRDEASGFLYFGCV